MIRAYIHDDKTKGWLEDLCKEHGIEVLTQQDVQNQRRLPAEYQFFLDQVDVLIVEATKPSQDLNFIIAQAMIVNKPTLCLYGKNQPPRDLLHYVKKKGLDHGIKTFSYTEQTIREAIQEFVTLHDPEAEFGESKPIIKFTLRFSPRIERYLDWYCGRRNISKADYIREFLEKQMRNDTEFRNLQPPQKQ